MFRSFCHSAVASSRSTTATETKLPSGRLASSYVPMSINSYLSSVKSRQWTRSLQKARPVGAGSRVEKSRLSQFPPPSTYWATNPRTRLDHRWVRAHGLVGLVVAHKVYWSGAGCLVACSHGAARRWKSSEETPRGSTSECLHSTGSSMYLLTATSLATPVNYRCYEYVTGLRKRHARRSGPRPRPILRTRSDAPSLRQNREADDSAVPQIQKRVSQDDSENG